MTIGDEKPAAEAGDTAQESQNQQRQTDGNASFLRAARAGNIDKVLEYLKGSTDINTSNANGLNALHLASKEGHVNVVQELLKRGANVDAQTKKGNTALHIASLAGKEDVVRILVENGAKVNMQSEIGFTPLYMAAQENHAEVVKFLLKNGASPSTATNDGFTPLAVALQQGRDKVVAVLLEADSKGKVKLPALHIAAKKDDVNAASLLLRNEHNVDLQSKSGFTPLHIAAHYGNVNVAALLIEQGADLNFKARNNITPMHVASKWGRYPMIVLLLDKGADINFRTRDGLTPVHCAARSGHTNVVDMLLERKANHSFKTKNGLTALHMAAQGDHEDSARLLLHYKAPVDDVTVDYLTALHVAAHCGNVNTAKLLLDRKCEVNARALNGFTPLHIACKKNRIKVVELLLKYGAAIEATTESGLTPLHVAAFMGHMNIVLFLLQHNANPDYPTVRGETPLHLAARANQTDIMRILLRSGASVDAKAREQQTPLHIAARLGNVDNVVLLLHNGASPDATTKDMYTPLHIASKEGQEEVASVLIDQGASLNLTTKKGFTPLHIAAKYGQIKVARLLLQRGAGADVQGKNGLTPLHVAAHYNNVNVALLLLDSGASPHCTAKNGYTPLHIAAKKNQMDIATTLLEYNGKPNAESKNGFTPLHLASQEGHTDMVSLLLEHGASAGHPALNGLTPMHLCAQEDKVQVAEILVKYDAPKDHVTKAGYTPLHTACHFGQTNMIRFLLEQGADVNAKTKLGYTPLHQAAQQGHVLVIKLLLKYHASPNAVANNGQTPLSLAQRLGYISVEEVLKDVTEVQSVPSGATMEEKYKVQAPETMQETFMSDSEDEGGEDAILGDTSYSYLNTDQFIGMRDDSITPKGGNIEQFRFSDYSDEYRQYPNDDSIQMAQGMRDRTSMGMSPGYMSRGPDETMQAIWGSDPSYEKNTKRGQIYRAGDPSGSMLPETPSYLPRTPFDKKLQDEFFAMDALEEEGRVFSPEEREQMRLSRQSAGMDPGASQSYTARDPAMDQSNAQRSEDVVHSMDLEDGELGSFDRQDTMKYIWRGDPADRKYQPQNATDRSERQMDPSKRAVMAATEDLESFEQSTLSPADKAAMAQFVYGVEDESQTISGQTPQGMYVAGQMVGLDGERIQPAKASQVQYATPQSHVVPGSTEESQILGSQTPQGMFISGHVVGPGGELIPVADASQTQSGVRYATAPSHPMYSSQETREIAGQIPEARYVSGQLVGPDGKPIQPGTTLIQSQVATQIGPDGQPLYSTDASAAYKPGNVPAQYQVAPGAQFTVAGEQRYYTPGQGTNGHPEQYDGFDPRGPLPEQTLQSYPWVQMNGSKEEKVVAQTQHSSYAAGRDSLSPSSGPPIYNGLNTSIQSPYGSSYSGTAFADTFDPDNVVVDRTPVYSGKLKWKSFLVSFMVDARGGAMRGCRHSGVRMIIPPGMASQPTRVTCRLVKKEKLMVPPPLNEGEALASRIIELGPVNAQFLGPVILEIPHFASLRGREREIVILRSDNGEKWVPHTLEPSDDLVNELLSGSFEGEDIETKEELEQKRIVRIVTTEFPQYFAIITRVRQESKLIGGDGGVISSTVVPQVQAVFSEGALTKNIQVGLQAQPVSPDLVTKMWGNRVAVSPIVTVEPRRRKFHKPITLTIPVPKAAQKGMINQYGGDAPTLRLLCSITGGTQTAQWEDITGTTPLTFVNDCVSFTTTVSARFWLMDCQNIGEASRMASDLYREAISTPFMSTFVVFAKRHEEKEARLRCFCMTDDKMDKTLESQEHFVEVARSRDVEVHEGKPQYVEMAGNLVPVTKSGEQLYINFHAFRENRLPFIVRIRDDDQDPVGRIAFMRELKVARGEAPQTPMCNLNITLPEYTGPEPTPYVDSKTILELREKYTLIRTRTTTETILGAELRLAQIADAVQEDWIQLAEELEIPSKEIETCRTDYRLPSDQALVMLHLWVKINGSNATGNELERALRRIDREDVVKKCMYDVHIVTDDVEKAMAKMQLEQTEGFEDLKEEVRTPRSGSLQRDASLDVSYDEQDLVKESESADEEEEESESEHDSIVESQKYLRRVEEGETVDPTAPDVQDLVERLAHTELSSDQQEERVSQGLDLPEDKAQYQSITPTQDEVQVNDIPREEFHDISKQRSPDEARYPSVTPTQETVEEVKPQEELLEDLPRETAAVADEERYKPVSPQEETFPTEITPTYDEVQSDEMPKEEITDQSRERSPDEARFPSVTPSQAIIDAESLPQETSLDDTQITAPLISTEESPADTIPYDTSDASQPLVEDQFTREQELLQFAQKEHDKYPFEEQQYTEELIEEMEDQLVSGSDADYPVQEEEIVEDEQQPQEQMTREDDVQPQPQSPGPVTRTEVIEGKPHTDTDVQEVEEILADGTVVKKKIIKTKTTQEMTERIITEGWQELTQSDIQRMAMDPSHSRFEEDFQPDDDIGDDTEIMTEEFEDLPQSHTDVEEFEETLPDGTTVIRRVIKTRVSKTVTRRIIEEGPEDDYEDEEDEPIEHEYGEETVHTAIDEQFDQPQIQQSDVAELPEETREEADERIIQTLSPEPPEQMIQDVSQEVSFRDEPVQTQQELDTVVTEQSDEMPVAAPDIQSPVTDPEEFDMHQQVLKDEEVIGQSPFEGLVNGQQIQAHATDESMEKTKEIPEEGEDQISEEQTTEQIQKEWRETEETGFVPRVVTKASYSPSDDPDITAEDRFRDTTTADDAAEVEVDQDGEQDEQQESTW